jgi:hypothetical protein
MYRSDQATCHLSFLTLCRAAVGMEWLLLGSPPTDKTALHLPQKQSLCCKHTWNLCQCTLKTDTKCQYSETNVMHIVLNWLRIKGLYTFRALLAHPQEVLNTTWYTACVLCQLAAPGSEFHAIFQSAVCVPPPKDEHIMLETCRGP